MHRTAATARSRVLLCPVALIGLIPLVFVGPAAGTDIVIPSDYYQARITGVGGLDILSREGRELVSGLAGFSAFYSRHGSYHKVHGNLAVIPLIREWQDSTEITADQNLGLLRLESRFRLRRHSPVIDCAVRVVYHCAIDSVFNEALAFEVLSPDARAVARDQRLRPVSRMHPTVTDRWTTRAVQFGSGTESVILPGEDNFLALRLRWDDDRWAVQFDLDRDWCHPFFVNWGVVPFYGVCDTIAAGSRRAGETLDYHYRIIVGARLPLVKRERQPGGYEAALVMTEHADCEGPLTSRAIAYGSSDSLRPIPGRGILGNGLTWTKSVFRWNTFGGRGANLGYYALSRPDFKEVVDSLASRGVDIALHSPRALTDTADKVALALREMRDWYGTRTWIDHGMDFNFEAVSKFGAIPESTLWYCIDTLRKYGVRYLWQSTDMLGVGYWGRNLFAPDRPDYYPPILYPLPRRFGTDPDPDVEPLFLWPAFAPVNDQQRDEHLSPGAVDQLVAERGLDILHLYFAGQDSLPTRFRPSYATWLIQHGERPFDWWETDPWVDGYFQHIADRRNAGLLWVPTLEQWGDFLLLADSVELRTDGFSRWLVTNHARRPIPGFALSVLADRVIDIRLEGVSLHTRKPVADDIMFWFDLPPDTTLEIQLELLPGTTTPLALAPARNRLLLHRGPRQHRVHVDGRFVLYQYAEPAGATWSSPETLGIGCAPALALNRSAGPAASWLSGQNLMFGLRRNDHEWRLAGIGIDTAVWRPAPTAALASSMINDDSLGSVHYLLYSARRRNSPQDQARLNDPSPVSIRLIAFDTARTYFDTLVASAAAGTDCSSPSIAVTPGDWLHLAWIETDADGDDLAYRTLESPLTPSQVRAAARPRFTVPVSIFPDTALFLSPAEPAIANFGDSVVCLFQAQPARSAPTEIFRTGRWLLSRPDSWSRPENLSGTPGTNSARPSAAGRSCVWQEQRDSLDSDIIARLGPQRRLLASGPAGAASPQVDVIWTSPRHAEIAAAWSESSAVDWVVRSTLLSIESALPQEFYRVACGESLASPYCRYRSGAIRLAAGPQDFGLDSLSYHLRFLDPDRDYRFACRVYAPGPDTLRQQIFLNDSLVAECRVAPESTALIAHNLTGGECASSCAASVRLRRTGCDTVLLAGILLYEQEPENHLPVRSSAQGNRARLGGTRNLQCAPNPFRDRLQITWRTAGSPAVPVEIHDVIGRQIRCLMPERSRSGCLTVTWDGLDRRGQPAADGVYFCRIPDLGCRAVVKVTALRR